MCHFTPNTEGSLLYVVWRWSKWGIMAMWHAEEYEQYGKMYNISSLKTATNTSFLCKGMQITLVV